MLAVTDSEVSPGEYHAIPTTSAIPRHQHTPSRRLNTTVLVVQHHLCSHNQRFQYLPVSFMSSFESQCPYQLPQAEMPETSQPLLSSTTPIKHKSALERLFSTYTHFCHLTLNAIGQEIMGSIVSPMPVQEFLNTFLPISHIPNYSSTKDLFKKGELFHRTVSATDEYSMYKPFVSVVCAQFIYIPPHTHFCAVRPKKWVNLPHSSISLIPMLEETRRTGINLRSNPTYPFITSRSPTPFPQPAILRYSICTSSSSD